MDAAKNSLILLTGARGFIGRAVRKVLQREGYSVLAVDLASSTEGSSGPGRDMALDISDANRLRELFEAEEIDGVIHLAAILPTIAQREPGLATQVNVIGSFHLLELAREFGARRIVFGSSLSAYGTCAADQAVSEEWHAAPEDVYGAAKLYIEQLGAAYRERFGLEFVSLRIGRVVGPGARSTTSAWRSQIFEFLRTNEPSEITIPYVACERLLLVHIDDVARALVSLLQAGHVSHTLYNAPCESVVVSDLKQELERLNPNIKVHLGGVPATGNPRLVDWSRLRDEFGIEMRPIFERLGREER